MRAIPVKIARTSAAPRVRNARRVTGLIGAIDEERLSLELRRAALTPDHYPGKSVVAFEAVPVNSLKRRVAAGLSKDDPEVTGTAGAIAE